MGHRVTLAKIGQHLEEAKILAESVQDNLLGHEWSMDAYQNAANLAERIGRAIEVQRKIPKVPDEPRADEDS